MEKGEIGYQTEERSSRRKVFKRMKICRPSSVLDIL